MLTKLLNILGFISCLHLTHVFLVGIYFILDNTTLYLFIQYGSRQIAHTRSICQRSGTGEWRSIRLLFWSFCHFSVAFTARQSSKCKVTKHCVCQIVPGPKASIFLINSNRFPWDSNKQHSSFRDYLFC